MTQLVALTAAYALIAKNLDQVVTRHEFEPVKLQILVLGIVCLAGVLKVIFWK